MMSPLTLMLMKPLNSSLRMSLGAGALEVSRGPNVNSREEISMATLEAGPPLKQPLTDTVTLNFKYFYLSSIKICSLNISS